MGVLHSHNLRLHVAVVFPQRLRRLNGLMLEDGQDRVDLYWEPKGNVFQPVSRIELILKNVLYTNKIESNLMIKWMMIMILLPPLLSPIFRTLPAKYVDKIAEQMRENNINALLIIGGFEVCLNHVTPDQLFVTFFRKLHFHWWNSCQWCKCYINDLETMKVSFLLIHKKSLCWSITNSDVWFMYMYVKVNSVM